MGTLFIRLVIGAASLVTLFDAAMTAQGNPSARQGPETLLLQGPGSEIRASVRELRPGDTRPVPTGGVVIDRVTRGGPAELAGLRSGDAVTEFDSVTVTDPKQFDRLVRDTPPGRKVKVILWRVGTRREVFISPIAATPR